MQKAFTLKCFFRFKNSFINKFKIPSNKPLRKKILLTTAILFANSTYIIGKKIFFDEPKDHENEIQPADDERQKKIQGLSKLTKVFILIFF